MVSLVFQRLSNGYISIPLVSYFLLSSALDSCALHLSYLLTFTSIAYNHHTNISSFEHIKTDIFSADAAWADLNGEEKIVRLGATTPASAVPSTFSTSAGGARNNGNNNGSNNNNSRANRAKSNTAAGKSKV